MKMWAKEMNRFPPKATYKRSADKEKASIIKTILIVSVTRKATIKTNVGEDVKKQHFPNFCWEFKMVCFGKFWQLLKKLSSYQMTQQILLIIFLRKLNI